MEDPRVPCLSASPQDFGNPPAPVSRADQMVQWRRDALDHYRQGLRALPAGRGPHTLASEDRCQSALSELLDCVLRQLEVGEAVLDLRAHGTLLNDLPGRDVSMLQWILSGGGPGMVVVWWPNEFLRAWRGSPALLSFCATPEPTDALCLQDQGASESNDATESTDDDNDTDQALFARRDAQGQRDMLLNYWCCRWFERNEPQLTDTTRLTNRQWLDVLEVLERIRLQGGRQKLVVELSAQWPAALVLSLNQLILGLREQIANRHLGVADIEWRVVDPDVPDALRSSDAYLGLCEFKVALGDVARELKAWVAAKEAALPWQMSAQAFAKSKIASSCVALTAAKQQLLEALDKMHDGQGACVDLSPWACEVWFKELRQHWTKWVTARAWPLVFGVLTLVWG